MKGLRKILSLAVALCTVASSLPVYAGQQTDSLGAIMYSGLTQASGDECSALDGWTIDASGEGSSAIVSEEGMIVLTKEGASNARATFSTAIEGDVYIETKLSTTGSARFEVFSSKGTMTYTDFYVKDSCIYTNKGIEPDSHSNINVASYISGADVILGLYFSPSRDVFDVYVNGEKKAENLSMRMMADYEKLTAVRISSLDAPTTTNVDYVRAYTINKKENTAPAIADVKATGIASYGRKLKAEYTYSDAEGDREGETEYKWLISDTEGGTYTAIPGAAGSTYAVGAEDGGKYIKLSVTPVDIFGNKGTEVVSAPVLVFAQKDTIYESTFDDNDVWTISKGGENSTAEITDSGESEKYIKTGTTSTDSYGYMTKALNFSGSFTVEFDAKVPAIKDQKANAYLMVMKQNTSAGEKDLMKINYYGTDNRILRMLAQDGNKQAGLDLSDWKRIKIDVNMNSKTMTLYVDGVTSQTWTNVNFTDKKSCTSTDPVVSMSIGVIGNGTTENADIRVKNIEIYQVKPYNTAPVAEDFIVRGVSAVGSTLYASYSYVDAEGDKETASDIKWYMSGSADGDYNEIEGANSLAYEIPAEYAGAYIKAVVTPKDYLGAAGEAVESEAFYVDYLTGDEITLTKPYGVNSQCTTGTFEGEGDSYTFTASDATKNRWLWGWTAFTGPTVMSFKVKNPDGINATINIPNGEFGVFGFENNVFTYTGAKIVTIANTIDKNHAYDIRLVFAGLSGSGTDDFANLYVDGKFIGKVNVRKATVAPKNISCMNIYTTGAGSLEISDLKFENIITEYPDFKVVSEDMFEPTAAGEPYEYSYVVKNASGKKKDFVAILALYKTVDGVETLESTDIYDEGLDLGDTSVYLMVMPEDSEAVYTAKVIKLESFKTMVPFVIE